MSQFHSHSYPAGESPIERLPPELLLKILHSVSAPPHAGHSYPISQRLPGTYATRNSLTCNQSNKLAVDPNAKTYPLPCLLSCLVTSRTLLSATLPAMYRNVSASRLPTLDKLLAQLREYPHLGRLVRKLDLSKISCSETPLAKFQRTLNPLLEVLSYTPLIRDFRISQSMEEFLTPEVIEKLFCGLPYLETLDLSTCNSSIFVEACAALLIRNGETTKSLKSLNLARCSALPSDFFESLLPQFPSLQHLDASNTQITSAALRSIPSTAKLAHLSISHCYALEGKLFVEFLAHHPTAKNLVYLDLETNPAAENQILTEDDVSGVLSSLPSTLRILNLKNAAMTSEHTPFLQPLGTRLEQLSAGAYMRLRDIEQLLLGPELESEEERETDAPRVEDANQVESKYKPTLTPMEQAIAVCKLRQRINSLPLVSSAHKPSLRYLDISSLPASEQSKIQMSVLLGPQTRPLEVIEISEKAVGRCGDLAKLCAAVGWELKSAEKRAWMRRKIAG